MVPLEVEEQVGPDGGALGDGDVRVLDPGAGGLDHSLPQPAVPGAQEGDREVAGGGGRHRGQQGGEGQHLDGGGQLGHLNILISNDNYTGHAVHQILENLVHDDEVVVILRECGHLLGASSSHCNWGLVQMQHW